MADIYVALDGSDTSGTGSSSSPYGTPNKAIGLATPNDNILLYGATYPYRVSFSGRNGASGFPITIKPVAGQTVTIAGQASTLYCILVSDSDYIIIDGLRIIYNPALTLPDNKMAWVRFQGSSNHSTIQNFYIKRDWVTSSGTPRTAQQEFNSGRREVGVSIGANCNDITVGGIAESRGGNSEILGINKCVQFTDYSTNCQVVNVNCHDFIQQGIDFQELDPSRDAGILIDSCIFSGSINEDGIQSHPNPTGTGARRIYGIRIKNCDFPDNAENAIDLKAVERITIENCIIHGTWGSSGGQFGVSASSFLPNRRSMHAVMVGDAEPGFYVIQRNNIYYDNPAATIFQQGWTAYNCTFHRNKSDYTGPESTWDDSGGQFPDFGGVIPTATSIGATGTGAFTQMGVRNCVFINEQVGIAMRSGMGDFDADWNAYVNMTGRVAAICDSAPYQLKTLAQWRTYLAAQGWSGGTEANGREIANLTACKYTTVEENPTGAYSQYDYSLDDTSPLKGTGGHLTTVVNAVTGSNTVTLANPSYFMDGYGRPGEGDPIYIVGAGAGARQITDINYTTGATVLDAVVTCAAGAKVYFGDSASSDIGVSLAATTPPEPPTASSSSSLRTIRVAAQITAGNQVFTLPVSTGFAALELRLVPVSADNVAVNGLSVSNGFFVSSSQQFCVAIRSTHGVSPSDTDRRTSTTDCVGLLNATSNNFAVRGAGVSIVGNLFTLNWITPPPAGYFVEIDTLPGTAASVVTAAVAQAQDAATPLTVGHAWNYARSLGNGKGLDSGFINAKITRGYATKIAGVLTQVGFGWWSQNGQTTTVLADQIFPDRFGGHVLTSGSIAWTVELANIAGNNIDLVTRGGIPTDPEVMGILFLNTDVPVWVGQIGIFTGAGVKNFTTPGFSVSAVNLVTTLLTAPAVGFSNGQASSFGTATLTKDANYSISLVDRDGVTTSDSESLSHAVPLDLRQFDGSAGLSATDWASLSNGFSLTMASTIGAIAIATAWGGGTFIVVFNDVVTGAPVLDSMTVKQKHVISFSDVVTGAPVLDSMTVLQKHSVVFSDVVTGAPVLDSMTVGQAHVVSFSDVVTGAPVLDSMAITELGGIVFNDVVTGNPVLDSMSIVQAHILTFDDVVTGAPVLDSMTILQAHVVAFDNVVTDAPDLDSMTVLQAHVLTFDDVVTGAPDLDTMTLTQSHVVEFNDVVTGAPLLPALDVSPRGARGLVTVRFRVRKPSITFRVGD